MTRVWVQFLGMFIVAAVAGNGVYTNALFFDTEKGDPNTLSATNLDGELTGLGISDSICLLSEETETELTVSNTAALPYTYDLNAANATGTACGSLEVQAFRNDVLEYTGSVAGLALSGFSLGTSESDTWRVKVKFPFEATGSCTFDTVVEAYQNEFLSGQAYFDTERTTHSVGVKTGPECGPSVNLHLTKAISGDPNGYELSDFSYRVVGEGIDTLVPHDGTVALPEGVYSIEELVPEGFVKPDWRIGWYGQCEAGDTFTTTITIDEGNVDHGTLYCQADNQYRPENNEEEEEPVIETTEEETVTDTRRDTRSSRETRSDETSVIENTSTTSEETVLNTESASSTDPASPEEEGGGEVAGDATTTEETTQEVETVTEETSGSDDIQAEPDEPDETEEAPAENVPTEEPVEETEDLGVAGESVA